MVRDGAPVPLALLAVLALGLASGAVNAVFIVRFRVMPFIVTLATLYLGRGLGLWLTETRAMNLPESLTWIGSNSLLGVPIPVAVLAAVLAAAHVTLEHTPFGRQLHATGHDPAAARKAGIRTSRILFAVYLVSGACAAIGSVVSLTQLGSVSPTFGQRYEFLAIATAVLGGTSLFGGRGKVFPGTVLGALLVQSVESGLVIVKANVYIYPLVIAAIIFLAVLIDGLRHEHLLRLGRRKIRAGELA
jgi:ribose transport system permease protein